MNMLQVALLSLLCVSSLVAAPKKSPTPKITSKAATNTSEPTWVVTADSWPPSPTEGVTAYQLYEITNGQRTAVGEPSLTPPITVTGVPAGTHVYALTALIGTNESDLSDPSNILELAVPKVLPPGAPIMTPKLAMLTNVSTRAYVQIGDKVEIGGFIIEGNADKRVIVRGIGPSLPLTGSLQHPQLELHDSAKILATNAGWKQTQEQEIIDSHLAPSNDSEAAIIAKLAPGQYTVILSDSKGQSGYGLVEVYSLDGI